MITQFDFAVLDAIQAIRFPVLDKVMVFVTHLGDEGIIWIALAVLFLCFKKTRKCGVMLGMVLISGLIVGNLGLKNLIARDRPYVQNPDMLDELLIKPLSSYSCPSGHTMSSVECAAVVFLWNKKAGIPALILATLIAFSRMYLYVHFLTDILLGALIGAALAIIVHFVYYKFMYKKIKFLGD